MPRSPKVLTVPKSKPSRLEHPAIIALAGEIPGAGAVVSYFVETVRSRREGALYDFLTDVADRIGQLKESSDTLELRVSGKLDRDQLASSDFLAVLAKAAEESAREPDEAKREYLLRFVTHYAMQRRPDIALQQIFWQQIRGISGMHVALLDELYKRQGRLSPTDLDVLAAQPTRLELLSAKASASILGVDPAYLEAIVAPLSSAGMLGRVPGPSTGEDRTPRLIITGMGQLFMRFLSGEWTSGSAGTST